jgi:hypothetical protein
MTAKPRICSLTCFWMALRSVLMNMALGQTGGADNPLVTNTNEVPEFREMGGAYSVTGFFITSAGLGNEDGS